MVLMPLLSRLLTLLVILTMPLFLARLTLIRSEERFSRNAETDLVCRLLLEKKKRKHQTRVLPLNSRYCDSLVPQLDPQREYGPHRPDATWLTRPTVTPGRTPDIPSSPGSAPRSQPL